MTKNKIRIKRALLNVIYPLIALAAIVAIWAIIARVKNLPILFPSVGEIFKEFGRLFVSASAWQSLGTTLLKAAESYAISFAAAAVFAAAGIFFKPFHRIMSPVVTVLRAAPTMAVILLGIVWLESESVPVLIGFLICFPLLYSYIYSALSGVDSELLEMASVYGVSGFDKFKSIYMPSVIPSVLDGVKSTVSLNIKVVIAAEVMALVRNTIGFDMMSAKADFDIAALLAWTIAAIALSFASELAVAGVKKLWEARR